MKNELLLKQAIELLQKVDPEELETVQINHTRYDDGSVGFTVELTYPPKEVGNVNIKVDGKHISEIVESHITDRN